MKGKNGRMLLIREIPAMPGRQQQLDIFVCFAPREVSVDLYAPHCEAFEKQSRTKSKSTSTSNVCVNLLV